ncbi:hypothetical protein TrCOL_g8819 [Triparma columacea]|nr:hypothetical protein TrCOL_g8819 [Triparma columacea]
MSAVMPKRRLCVRDLPFHQSSNKLRIRNSKRARMGRLLSEDWFHVFLRLTTIESITYLIVCWTVFILIFAGFYVAADTVQPDVDCGLTKNSNEILGFSAAFAFSLETTTTVGYGLPGSSNAFFEGCPELQVVIYFQMLFSILFNAFLFAFFFARVARCETRGIQVVFGQKAIIKRLRDGRFTFNFRVYDVDSRCPLVEAHVRLYAIKKDIGERDMKFEVMRLSSPNDDLGAVIYPSLPSVVSHTIDSYSPIHLNSSSGSKVEEAFHIDSCGMDLREDDSRTGGRDDYRCMVCGETYSTVDCLTRHIAYSGMLEKNDSVGKGGGAKRHLDVSLKEMKMWKVTKDKQTTGTTTGMYYEEFKSLFETEEVEILAVVEAIDPLMSGTFQAIQSYTAEDLEFGGNFAPCLVKDYQDKKSVAAVDLAQFHRVIGEGAAV